MTDIIGDDGDREWLCTHGTGHPYHIPNAPKYYGVHTCDGCCQVTVGGDNTVHVKSSQTETICGIDLTKVSEWPCGIGVFGMKHKCVHGCFQER